MERLSQDAPVTHARTIRLSAGHQSLSRWISRRGCTNGPILANAAYGLGSTAHGTLDAARRRRLLFNSSGGLVQRAADARARRRDISARVFSCRFAEAIHGAGEDATSAALGLSAQSCLRCELFSGVDVKPADAFPPFSPHPCFLRWKM